MLHLYKIFFSSPSQKLRRNRQWPYELEILWRSRSLHCYPLNCESGINLWWLQWLLGTVTDVEVTENYPVLRFFVVQRCYTCFLVFILHYLGFCFWTSCFLNGVQLCYKSVLNVSRPLIIWWSLTPLSLPQKQRHVEIPPPNLKWRGNVPSFSRACFGVLCPSSEPNGVADLDVGREKVDRFKSHKVFHYR